jgi:hypothetical protein
MGSGSVMGPSALHVFLELVTVGAFVASAAHAVDRWGARLGGWWVASLLWLGWVRESFVVLREVLYGFAPLALMLGKTPLISAVIWGFSIHAATVFAETVTGESLSDLRPSVRFYGLVALFMAALACFFEPFLALTGMARWEAGTGETLGVPWIALVGYTTMATLFLWIFCGVLRRARGPRQVVSLTVRVACVALVHAQGLTALKRLLGW